MKVEAASSGDVPAVLDLLRAARLPPAGVESHFDQFLVARDEGGRLAGCVGAEVYGDVALLRSLAVSEAARSSGIGRSLVEALIHRSRERGVRRLFLLTTTAEAYFPRFGFEVVPRSEADPRLEASEELRGACPDSAVLMRLEL